MPKQAWTGELSLFGKYLKKHKVNRGTIAKGLGKTPSYISMLAHGKATPGFKLALEIEKWTRENVTSHGHASPYKCTDWKKN